MFPCKAISIAPATTKSPHFFKMNSNQNNFLIEGKTSSRVSQAPGGTSSINLGWDDHNDEGKDWLDYFHLDFKYYEFPVPLSCLAHPQVQIEKETRKTTNNTFASGDKMNSGNVLTDRPSSRILNPPGGRSSICLRDMS